MAVIPLSDTVSAARVQGDRLSYKSLDVLSAPGQALEGLGQAISTAARAQEAKQKEMDGYNANVALERWSTEQTIQYQNDLANTKPDGSDFVQTRERNLLDSYDKLRKTIKDPEIQRRADMVFEKFRGNQIVQGFGDVDTKRTIYVKDTTQEAMRSVIDSGSIKTADDFNGWYKNNVLPRIDQYVTDPKQKDALKELFGKSLANEFLYANPTFAAPKKTIQVGKYGTQYSADLRSAIVDGAKELGVDPVDLATIMSYETGGTFDDWKAGPTTKWGQHRGLIQWGEPQRAKYRVYQGMPVRDQVMAAVQYLKDAGVKPGMNRVNLYAAINAGDPSKINASDAQNGGAPGTVLDKVNYQMSGHEKKAVALLGGGYAPSRVQYAYNAPTKPTGGMWDYIDTNDWQKATAFAERQMQSEMAVAKAELNATLDDYYSSLRTSGTSDLQEPTIDVFEKAYGDNADRAYEEHVRNKQLALDENTLADKSTGQILTLIETRKEEMRSGTGAATDEKRLAELQREANAILNPREASIKAQEAEQRKLFNEAETKRRQDLRVRLDGFSDDVITAASEGKNYTGWTPSMKDYTDVFGEFNGPLIYARQKQLIKAASDASGFNKMSPDELKTAMNDYKSQLTTGDGAKDAAERYAAIQRAAESVMKAREDDIAGYVQTNFPEVNKFFDQYVQSKDPKDLAAGYDMMKQIQTKLGIPEDKQRLLPKSVAKNAVETFNDIERPVDERMAAVSGLVFGAGAEGYSASIKKQLVEAGMPRSATSALAAYERGDEDAARRLFDASMQKKDADKLVKLSETDRRSRDVALNDALLGASGKGHLLYNLDAPDADTLEQVKADRDLMERAIDVRLAKGESLSSATSGALSDLFGNRTRLTSETKSGSGIDVLMPDNIDAATVTRGLSVFAPQVKASIQAMVNAEIADKLKRNGGEPMTQEQSAIKLMMETQARVTLENIMSNGFFKSVDDKVGFFNPYSGTFVAGPDGKPMLFTFDEISGAAADARRNDPQGFKGFIGQIAPSLPIGNY